MVYNSCMSKVFFLLPLMAVLVACTHGADVSDVYDDYYDDDYFEYCAPTSARPAASDEKIIVASPNGNDLVLETKRHIIHIAAQSDAPHEYRVWSGGNESADPELIVSDGVAIIAE